MKSEDIVNRRWTESEKIAMRAIAQRQAKGDDSQINLKDIPPLTPEQLAGMIRLRDRRPKVEMESKR